MNREQIIDAFVKDGEYRDITRRVAGADADDLYQELVLFVLEIPDEKLARLNDTCLKCFFYRMAQKQYNSKNSAFYRKYKKERYLLRDMVDAYEAPDEPAPDDKTEKVDRAIQDLSRGPAWYDIALLTLYAEKGSQSEVAKATGIPFRSVSHTVQNARKLIIKKINKYE